VDAPADAFGHALMDWVGGGTVPEVYERDDGFVEVGAGPELFLAEYRHWPSSERQAMRHARGRVIDVGCGAGRVALHLQGRGTDVVGLDVSLLAARACRIRGLDQMWCGSITGLSPSIRLFDTVVLFGNNLGVFGRPERLRRTLTEWARRMEPGARILAESTSPYGGGAPAVDRAHTQRNRQRRLMPGLLKIRIRYRHWATGWFPWLFVSPSEMRTLVRGTGWRTTRMLTGAPDEPYVAVLERDRDV
jgi:SAM-dependent methyltransferase